MCRVLRKFCPRGADPEFSMRAGASSQRRPSIRTSLKDGVGSRQALSSVATFCEATMASESKLKGSRLAVGARL